MIIKDNVPQIIKTDITLLHQTLTELANSAHLSDDARKIEYGNRGQGLIVDKAQTILDRLVSEINAYLG